MQRTYTETQRTHIQRKTHKLAKLNITLQEKCAGTPGGSGDCKLAPDPGAGLTPPP
jgi:hypothetical protein